jgi:CRP/FNR family transcriptional regulator, cyclic AMP receptor protein
MISPELLRRYPFFGRFTPAELREIAMLADETEVTAGVVLFENGDPADTLYLLVEGGVDLFDVSVDEHDPKLRKEFFVGEIDQGEMLSISALVEPYKVTAAAKVTTPSRFVQFNAVRLREYADRDPGFGYKLMQAIARLTLDRLAETRVMLAGAQG